MNASKHPPGRQRGIVALWAVIFLIVGVILTLTQVYDIAGSRGTSTSQQSDSTAAFFLAESGLQRNISILENTTYVTGTDCGIPASTFSLGAGSVTAQVACTSQNTTPCSTCVITSTGTIVGSASRTVKATLKLTSADEGSICNADTGSCQNTVPPGCPGSTCTWEPDWSFTLANTTPNTAIALFNLAAERQNASSGSICPPTYPGVCSMLWNLDAQNGQSSIGNMGNAISIAPSGSFTVFQTLTGGNYSVAEVGVLFTGSGTTPSLIPSGDYHAYWNQTNNGDPGGDGLGTGGKKNNFSGGVINGAVLPTGSCALNDTASLTAMYLDADPNPPNKQNDGCTNWCYGGDTLAMGIALSPDGSAIASLPYDPTATIYNAGTANSTVWFNTAGGLSPDGTRGNTFPLKRIVSYPLESGASAEVKLTFPKDVVSEIWYAHNPNYLSAADAYSGAKFNGYIGQTVIFTGTIKRNPGNDYRLNITSAPLIGTVAKGSANVYSIAGSSGIPTGTTFYILDAETLTGAPQNNIQIAITNAGNLGLSNGQTSSTHSMGVPGTVMTVTSPPTGSTIADTDKVFSGTAEVAEIDSLGTGMGTYNLNVSRLLATTPLQTDGAIVTVTGTGGAPTGDALSTNILVALKSGQGRLPSNTSIQVDISTATSLELDKRPAIPLNNAQICGGTCAFFDHSATGTRTTQFRIPDHSGVDYYWSAGFICLSGANQAPTVIKSRTNVTSRAWTEVVQ